MWHDIGQLLVAQSVVGFLVQTAFVTAIALAFIYWIVSMRKKTVVILSHRQLVISTLVSAAATAGLYQAFLAVGPAERWSKWWVFGAAMIALMVTRWATMIVVPIVDRERSLRDTMAGQGAMFNCNWPLISRCTNQAMLFLIAVYLVVKNVLGQEAAT